MAPPPSHTTGHTVFRIRRLDPAAYHAAKRAGRRQAAACFASCIAFYPEFRGSRSGFHWLRPATVPPFLPSPAPYRIPPYGGRTFQPGIPGNLMSRSARFSASFAPWSFGPSLRRHYPPSSLLRPLLTSPSLSRRRSPQVRRCIFPFTPLGSTLYVFGWTWASRWPARLPPVPGLTADSCSCGQRFVPRFLQLHLAATPCGSLRLPRSAPVGSFHPTRSSPCWAHWRKAPALPGRESSRPRPASKEWVQPENRRLGSRQAGGLRHASATGAC